jgi:H+/Cl- antiporter ClcA
MVWAALAGPILGIAAAGYIWVIGWADRKKFEGVLVWVVPIVTLSALGVVAIPFPQLLGNGKDLVQRAFLNRLDLTLLLLLPFLKLAAVTGCLRAGIPGGLFTPTMTCGALLGGLLGHLSAGLAPSLPPASCAIIGAGAFLASAIGGPISSITLMLELTRHIQGLLVPLMLAVALASLTTRTIERRTIYTARFHPVTPAVAARVFAGEKIQAGTP